MEIFIAAQVAGTGGVWQLPGISQLISINVFRMVD